VDADRVYPISALTREGCEMLCFAIFEYLQSLRLPEHPDPDVRFDENRASDGDLLP
jgi:GTP-binding protein